LIVSFYWSIFIAYYISYLDGQETDIIGSFLAECTAMKDENRIPASDLYAAYTLWAKDNGYRQMNNKNFIAELRRRLDVRRGGMGNIVVG